MKDASGGLWSRIGENYTKSALTREEDKLVAIQGTAKLLRPIPDDDHLAELWRKSLTYDLLWVQCEPQVHLSAYEIQSSNLVLGVC